MYKENIFGIIIVTAAFLTLVGIEHARVQKKVRGINATLPDRCFMNTTRRVDEMKIGETAWISEIYVDPKLKNVWVEKDMYISESPNPHNSIKLTKDNIGYVMDITSHTKKYFFYQLSQIYVVRNYVPVYKIIDRSEKSNRSEERKE